MKDKGHFYLSVLKSFIRIAACVAGFVNINYLLIGFIGAEILGILEEVADKR